MEDELNQGMITYYEERAGEYDEFYSGKSPGIPRPDAYKKDLAKITKIVSRFGKGHLIDIGCGTGFWLAHYGPNCSGITLIDKSEKMLSECKKRAQEIGLIDKCCFLHADFLEIDFKESRFDGALFGFLISHFINRLERSFFVKLKRILRPGSELMLIDSAWTETRRPHRNKQGLQKRVLNDGREFTIYKKYLDGNDVKKLFKGNDLKLQSLYLGGVFLAAIGKKHE